MIAPYTGPPMDLANMRKLGVRELFVTCLECHHEADVNVDRYDGTESVPSFANRWPCGKCGERSSAVRPAWHTGPNQVAHPR
jgi:hypothetical protein